VRYRESLGYASGKNPRLPRKLLSPSKMRYQKGFLAITALFFSTDRCESLRMPNSVSDGCQVACSEGDPKATDTALVFNARA